MFRHFIGHLQIFSKINKDRSIYSSARAHCVDREISTSTLYYVIWNFYDGMRVKGSWLDSAIGA